MQADVLIPNHVPIAYSTRGGHVENVFYGSIAVVDRTGALLASVGDVKAPIFTRSALKPLQALPLVANPRFSEYGLTPTPRMNSRQNRQKLCKSNRLPRCDTNSKPCGFQFGPVPKFFSRSASFPS